MLCLRIERQVQFKNIDTRLSEEPELAIFGVGGDELT